MVTYKQIFFKLLPPTPPPPTPPHTHTTFYDTLVPGIHLYKTVSVLDIAVWFPPQDLWFVGFLRECYGHGTGHTSTFWPPQHKLCSHSCSLQNQTDWNYTTGKRPTEKCISSTNFYLPHLSKINCNAAIIFCY